MKISRNAPCPCGSGKKYKRCCIRSDSVDSSRSLDRAEQGFDEGPPNHIIPPGTLEAITNRLPKDQREHLMPLLKQMEVFNEYESHSANIESAAAILDKHHLEYEDIISKPEDLCRRAEELFEEKPFTDMRFSVADVQRAFESVGYPVGQQIDKTFPEIMEKAVRFLVDDQECKLLSRRLLLLLPEYVNAGRYLDGWIIQHNALLTDAMKDGPIGQFLLAMFLSAVREWFEQRDQDELSMFRELDTSPEEIKRMGFDDAGTWLRKVMENPKKQKAIENFVATHPELQAFSDARCEKDEDAALDLLRSGRMASLYLTLAEIKPWLPILEERINQDPELRETLSNPRLITETIGKKFAALMSGMCIEMADKIFTSERLKQLASDLGEYQSSLSPEDEKNAHPGICGALVAVTSDRKPSENSFLSSLCWQSLQSIMDIVREENK